MDISDLIAEIKNLKAKIKEIEERKPGVDTTAIETRLEKLEKQLDGLEETDFGEW